MNYSALLSGKNAVILNGRDPIGKSIVALFERHGANVLFGDGDPEFCDSVNVASIHVVVINPSDPPRGDLLNTTDEDDTLQLTAHQLSIMRTMRAFWDKMLSSGGGSTIIITSNTVGRIIPGDAVYTAAKAASGGMTRVSGLENADENMRVNEILAGDVDPDALADAVLFLASDMSSYITGESIAVDCGAMRNALS